MSLVFLDTVGVIALLDEADQWHAAAQGAYDAIRQGRFATVTTSYVLLECGNAASRRPYRQNIAEMEERFREKGRLVFPTESDWALAWRAYEQAPAGGPSIVDCVSFEVMRRLGLRQVFTNDRHFADAGFETLF